MVLYIVSIGTCPKYINRKLRNNNLFHNINVCANLLPTESDTIKRAWELLNITVMRLSTALHK